MPRSRSSSFESITRSTTASLARKVPLWRSMASTRVVLPWSTCAMIAMLRIPELNGFLPGGKYGCIYFTLWAAVWSGRLVCDAGGFLSFVAKQLHDQDELTATRGSFCSPQPLLPSPMAALDVQSRAYRGPRCGRIGKLRSRCRETRCTGWVARELP